MSSRRNPEARDDWQTPDLILERVRRLGSIAFDPATAPGNPTGAVKYMTEGGLESAWSFDGLAFVNPPYRVPWYRKIEHEVQRLDQGQELVALIPAKPGTAYFQDLSRRCSAVCFLRGRLTFRGAEQQAPFESAVLYAGARLTAFRDAFADLGWVVQRV
jgi:hypothetical protein